MSPGPALPRPLRPRRLSLCCLSLFSLCCLSLLSLCRLSLLSLFFPQIPDSVMVPCWFTVYPSPVVSSPVCSALGGLQSRLLRPGSGRLQSRLLALVGSRSVCSTLGGPSPVCSAWWAPVRLLHPGGSSPVCSAQVGSRSVCSALAGSSAILSALASTWTWPSVLPLFRLRSTAHHGLFRSVWKPLLGGGAMSPHPGHELCFTPHSSVTDHSKDYISHHPLHQHSCLQLITHTPANNHPITITPITHTHTHYISPGHSPIHCRVLLASLPTKRFPSFLSLFPCVPIPPLPLDYLSALPTGLSLPIADPRLPKDSFCLVYAIPVCSCPTLPVLTMYVNKKLAFGSECLTSRHPRHKQRGLF